MKKLIYYAGIMIIVILLLPMLIVKSCGKMPEKVKAPQRQEKLEQSEEIIKKEKPEKVKVQEKAENKEYIISVYDNNLKRSEEMDLEEYIKGVVAAEMPAEFHPEALKAQAIAARTYAYGRFSGVYESKTGVHDGIDVCKDSTHCQAWISREAAIKKWNVFFASKYWSKIAKAVDSTKGLIVVYDGKVANTLFHSSSSERTENSEDVWPGVSVPYLRSVTSTGDEEAKGFEVSTNIKSSEIIEKLKEAYPNEEFHGDLYDSINVLEYTAGGRVKTLKIGDITLKGTEFRTLLGLRSTNFVVEKVGKGTGDKQMLRITTRGYGHGVGMSQYGADSLAKKGGTCMEILKHYYTGVDVIPISDYEHSN